MRVIKEGKALRQFFIASLLVILMACGSPRQKVKISNKLTGLDKLPPLKLAILPLEGTQEGARFFREALHVSLMDMDLDIIERFLVDGTLKKKGWNNGSHPLIDLPPQKLGEALGADALLYGKVTKWGKFYAILHSSVTAGLELKLVDARTGELLWKCEQFDWKYEGLMKLPLGMVAAGVSPLMFVAKKDNLIDLANNLSKNITKLLKKPSSAYEEDVMDHRVLIASAEEYIMKMENYVSDKPYAYIENFAKRDFTNQEGQDDAKVVTKGPQHEFFEEGMQSDNNFPDNKTAAYTIQVGSFLEKKYAKTLIEKLEEKGYEAFMDQVENGKKFWYKVQIDRFKNKKDAVWFANKIQKSESLKYFITTTDVPSSI